MISAFLLLLPSLAAIMNNADAAKRDWTKDWTTWSPRAEIAPRFAAESSGGPEGGGALKIEGKGDSVFWGSWRKKVSGISGGRTYRFTAHFRAKGVPHPQRSISARITWLNAKGGIERPADFILNGEKHGEWNLC